MLPGKVPIKLSHFWHFSTFLLVISWVKVQLGWKFEGSCLIVSMKMLGCQISFLQWHVLVVFCVSKRSRNKLLLAHFPPIEWTESESFFEIGLGTQQRLGSGGPKNWRKVMIQRLSVNTKHNLAQVESFDFFGQNSLSEWFFQEAVLGFLDGAWHETFEWRFYAVRWDVTACLP